MNEILLANLFFIITGSAALVVGTFVCIACCYLIGLIRIARALLERLETSTEVLVGDVKAWRDRIVNGTLFGRVCMAVVDALTNTTQKRRVLRQKKDGGEKNI